MSKKIRDDLWQVGGGGLSAPSDAAIYLVRHGDKAALIDAGTGQAHDQVLANIQESLPQGVDIPFLFLTHCHYDHTGGARALADACQCRIAVHTLDAEYLSTADNQVTAACWYGARMEPLVADHEISGQGQTFEIGTGKVEAVHIPGHSPGSVAYVSQVSGEKVLFGQDVHGPLSPDLLSVRADYEASLKIMLDMEADLLCEGHFGIISGKETVGQFISSYMD